MARPVERVLITTLDVMPIMATTTTISIAVNPKFFRPKKEVIVFFYCTSKQYFLLSLIQWEAPERQATKD